MFGAIAQILTARGKPIRPLVDFEIRDDGAGPYIASWNTAVLGAQPTAQELAAVSAPAADAATKTVVAERELAMRGLKALAIAVHKRLKSSVPADSVTAQQWEAAIRAEWDALG